MMKLTARSKLTPEEVTRKAREFFGQDGYGLSVTEETPTSVCLDGGGGTVEIAACAEAKGTRVDLASLEWDAQVKEFVEVIT